MDMKKERAYRVSVVFSEGERPEFASGRKATFVVTQAVLAYTSVAEWLLVVYGYRKESPLRDDSSEGWKSIHFTDLRGLPEGLKEPWRKMITA